MTFGKRVRYEGQLEDHWASVVLRGLVLPRDVVGKRCALVVEACEGGRGGTNKAVRVKPRKGE